MGSIVTIEVELERLPVRIDVLERFEAARVLLRYRAHLIGVVELPIRAGRLTRGDLHRAIWSAGSDECDLAGALARALLADNPGAVPTPSASVAVCSRDRPERLRRCLAAIARLHHRPDEVLVVDSASTGPGTREAARAYGVRYLREDRPGLSRARNRALREARHDVVAFTDDDAIPDADWLGELVASFLDPLVLCATGITLALDLETPAQRYFEARSAMRCGFRRRVHDRLNHDALHPSVGAGVNMAVRRSVLDTIGPFDERLGPGTSARASDDTQMFGRILGRGYRIVYQPSALCWHEHRRDWADLRRALAGYALGTYVWHTGRLVEHSDLRIVRLWWRWLRHHQLPGLARSLLRRPGAEPLDMTVALLWACARGPAVYLGSRLRTERASSGA
jgi:cellulose synthase/poly-beta-1,6-N-acetylglucosamine synthase-like glycosyltransferase